jgi:hypothetical protein
MFCEQIEQVIHSSSLRDLDHVAKLLWQGLGNGSVSEADAERLATLVEVRRSLRRAQQPQRPIPLALAFTPRKTQRSPDRQRSKARRRQLAAAGPLPPPLAAMFTTGELAVLAVIVFEVRQNGVCDRPIDELVARSGTSRTTVQRAVRFAAISGLITKEERPRRGCKSLTNVIRVVSQEWLTWLKKRPAPRPSPGPGAYRVPNSKPHGQQVDSTQWKGSGSASWVQLGSQPRSAASQSHSGGRRGR